MENQLVELALSDWDAATPNEAWIAALEAGKVLYFPQLGFQLLPEEQALLSPAVLSPDVRNISLTPTAGSRAWPATRPANRRWRP